MLLVGAVTRGDVADYVGAVFAVYIVLLFVYLVTTMAFAFGLRTPYWRGTDVVLGFLRDISEPYLRIFRRFIPQIGMLDLSPLLALIVLYILDSVITSLIRG